MVQARVARVDGATSDARTKWLEPMEKEFNRKWLFKTFAHG